MLIFACCLIFSYKIRLCGTFLILNVAWPLWRARRIHDAACCTIQSQAKAQASTYRKSVAISVFCTQCGYCWGSKEIKWLLVLIMMQIGILNALFVHYIYAINFHMWLLLLASCAHFLPPLELKDARARFSQTKRIRWRCQEKSVVQYRHLFWRAALRAAIASYIYVCVCVGWLVGWLLRLVHSLVVASLLSRLVAAYMAWLFESNVYLN